MASYVETTAVALRRGSTTANEQFVGVQGELVADLGSNMSAGEGTDINTTIRLHNGITPGGIPMARADFGNITTQALAENRNRIEDKNLAYADLSNLEKNSNPEQIVRVFTEYGFAKKAEVDTALETYAKKDMSNVDTTPLATNKGDKNLAYSNTSNINTANLTDINIHNGVDGNKPLAYYDLSNVNLQNLTTSYAKKDLSNVSTKDLKTALDSQNVEYVANKDTVINAAHIQPNHYPTTKAVVDYITSDFDNAQKLNTNFSNATTWTPLYISDHSYYKFNNSTDNIIQAGTNFVADKKIYTGIVLTNDLVSLGLYVTEIDTSSNIKSCEFTLHGGTQDISDFSPVTVTNSENGQAKIYFTSAFDTESNLYLYTVTNIETVIQGGFDAETEYALNENIKVSDLLYIKITAVENGGITGFEYRPAETTTEIADTTLTLQSTGTAAQIYLNKTNICPAIGGAGLLKADLTNLAGMSAIDQETEKKSDWRIRHNIPIANQPSVEDYYRIVTAGLVADSIMNNISIVRQEIETVRQEIPSVPAVGNGTITIKQGTVTKGTFAVNQTADATITLDAPNEPVVVNELPTEIDNNTIYYILEN